MRLLTLLLLAACLCVPPAAAEHNNVKVRVDTLPAADAKTRYSKLTEADFEMVAKELNVEVAAIKAVVQIEAGAAMQGFFAPGVPVVNFDASMYSIYRRRTAKGGDKNAKVPSGLSGYGLREWTQLTNAKQMASSPGFYLHQNDVIYVEPNSQRKRSSTVNGNNALSVGFWVSVASLLTSVVTTVAVFINK